MNNSIATANPTTTADPVVLNRWKDFVVGDHYNLNVFRHYWTPDTNTHTKVSVANVSGKLVQIKYKGHTELYARVIDRHQFVFETADKNDDGTPVLYKTGMWNILSAYRYDPSNLDDGVEKVFDSLPKIYKDRD